MVQREERSHRATPRGGAGFPGRQIGKSPRLWVNRLGFRDRGRKRQK